MQITNISKAKLITDLNDKDHLVTVGYSFNTGSYNENKDNYGIAHLTEHLVFRGTTTRTSEEINRYIESLGGYMNAYTSFENTKFYCTVPAEYWKEAIELINDICFFNTIPEDEFELEKDIVINELKMYEDDSATVCQENLFRLMFNNAENRQLVGGTPKTVEPITREQVIDYIDTHFTTNNLSIIVTGNVNEIELENYLNNILPDTEDAEEFTQEFNFNIKKTLIKTKKEGVQQSQLSWGIVGPGIETQDQIPFALIMTYLGGNASSILYTEIREKRGFVYTVRTDMEWFKDYSILIGYASLNESNIKKTIQIIEKEFKNINMTEEQLDACKNYNIGAMYREMETTVGRNDDYTSYTVDVEKRIQQVKNTTLQEIQEVVDKYFNQKIVYSIVTPKGVL